MPGKLTARLVGVDTLNPGMIEQMWSVFEGYYDDVDRGRFEADLARKERVILLVDAQRIVGFSTMTRVRGEIDGKPYIAMYSGDTIVERPYWGETALQRIFGWTVFKFWLSNLGTPTYWFLISKGYKTYLLLTRNWVNRWPAHGSELPPFEGAVMDDLCTRLFASAWKPDRGLVIFDEPMGRLKPGVVDSGKLPDDADVDYFVSRNPGHARGDELACLGRFDVAAFTNFFSRQALPWRRRRAR